MRLVAHLALLTAFAPYQVDDAIIAEFRRVHADAGALMNVTEWASSTAARRIAGWMTRQKT
jgi:hypothetical protein